MRLEITRIREENSSCEVVAGSLASSVTTRDREGVVMTKPQVKNLDRPDESREFPNGADALVTIGAHTIGRAEFRPGWRWSNDVQPVAGTASCQVHHLGYLMSGTLHVETDDGAHTDLVAGDAFEILPGHDAWVVGDTACHLLDWPSAAVQHTQPKPAVASGTSA